MKSRHLLLTVLGGLFFTACTVLCAATTNYTISVSVTGLTSGSLVMHDNKSDLLTFTTNDTQTFATQYASGSNYTVTIKTQPTGQTCTMGSNSTGMITSDITVAVTCAKTVDYKISVAVTGLTGTLVMQDSKNSTLTFTTNNTQTFALQYPKGSTYTVTVQTQPAGQTCTLSSNASGTINSNITVTATCTSNTSNYTISVAVTGLTGTLVMQDSQSDTLTFTTNNTQTFAKSYASGSTYTVTVKTQPSGQTCTLSSNASGTITSNITVTATCTTSVVDYTISVAVTGLTGTLVVQDNLGASLTFTTNTTKAFSSSYASGSTYSVTVETQPAGQTCALSSNASGTITSNITVTATCTTNSTYTISVAVTGLTGTLVVQDNVGPTLSFTTNTTQTFSNTYASGSTYSVTVETQPSGQTCTLGSNASGTITSNITVTATCTTSATYTIGGTVSGLTGTGLQLQDNGGNTLSVTANGSFTFSTKLPSGSTYDVTVSSQPTGQTCTPTNNTGTVGSSNVTSVVVTCSSATYTISVAVTGLTGSVELQDDQGATLTFSSNDTQTFSNTYASGAAYTVSITSQPLTVSCIPTYATGTITANITIFASCNDGALRPLGTVSNVSTVSCPGGGIANGVCQQMTVSCPDVPSVSAYVKTNTPTGTPLGLASYGTGTEGNGLYDTQFTYGTTAVGNVLDAGFITVQISWGTPFNSNQPNGWVQGPGGVLAASCNYATVVQWIQKNIGTNTPNLPQCATGNSGGAGALAYVLSQYPQTLSMAEVTSGPPTGRLDWGCGCTEGKLAVQCGDATTLGTCFGKTDGAVWDGAYSPNTLCSTAAGGGALPPGGLSFFLGDSAEAPGANYNFPNTYVNLVFGNADGSSAIPIGQDWFNKITSSKAQVCVAGGLHSMANTLPGADQIANDLISLCKLQ
jgi:hypothetical protein